MSLINDALKKAKQAQKAPPLPPSTSGLKPAEGATVKRSELPMLIAIIGVMFLGVVALVVTFRIYKRNQMPLATTHASEQPLAATASSSVTPKSPVTTSAPSTPAPVSAAQTPPPALPKLQGIFSSPTRPSAVIDGRTVFVGEHAGDFEVMAISPGKVIVSAGGQNYTLTLPQ